MSSDKTETEVLEDAQARVEDAVVEHDDDNPIGMEDDADAEEADPFLRKLHFELRKDPATKRWDWVLWAPNHRAIATNAKSYSRRNDAERAIRRMRKGAGVARVVIATM